VTRNSNKTNLNLFAAATIISSTIVPEDLSLVTLGSAIEQIRNQNMSGKGDLQAPPAPKAGRGLLLSSERDALPLLTLDSQDYEVVDFWTKVLVVRVQGPDLLEAMQIARLRRPF
jgi:hypothetical protein